MKSHVPNAELVLFMFKLPVIFKVETELITVV